MSQPKLWVDLYPKWLGLWQEVKELYRVGFTAQEVGDSLNLSKRHVLLILRRMGYPRRTPVARNPNGESSNSWKGARVSYHGAHSRVSRILGKATECIACGRKEPETVCEWASLNQQYHNPDDYISLCGKCHRNFDEVGRKGWETRRKRSIV